MLWIGQTAVVTLPAEIDITNADQIRGDLLSVLNQGADLLIADLSKTTFCDSAGVAALARTFWRAEASQSEMRLAVSTLAVQRVLALTGVDRLLDIYPSVTASLAGPHDSPRDSLAQNDKVLLMPSHVTWTDKSCSNAGGGCGGSPLTLVMMALAMSRSFTLLCCDADRRIAKARAWVQCSRAITIQGPGRSRSAIPATSEVAR